MTTSILDQIRAKKQLIADKKAGSKNAYRFKQRSTMIRILPSWRDGSSGEDTPFYHDFGQAFIKDLDGNLLAVIGDRRMTYGEDDPVRNLIQLAMSEAPTDAQREHYKQILAKQKHLVNALILNDKDIDPTVPEIVELSQTQLDIVLGQMEKICLDGENPLDLDAGYNLEVEKEGTGLMTRYKFLFERRPSKVDTKVMDSIIDLDSFVRAKFQDSDRAINALKSMSQGAALPSPSAGRPALDYNNSSRVAVEEADFSVVADAKEGVRDMAETTKITVSDAEIEALLKDL